MARLYADEDFSDPVTQLLRQLGHDILTAHQAGHAGIIVCTRDDDVAALANRIHQQIQSAPPLQGQLLRVNRPSS